MPPNILSRTYALVANGSFGLGTKEIQGGEMKSKFLLFSAAIAVLFILAACAPAAAPPPAAPAATSAPVAPAATTAPEATAAPVATTAPAETAAPAEAFVGDKVAAPDCNYGSADAAAGFKSMEAVDKYTVKFELCHIDPAFIPKIAFITNAIGEKAVLDAAGGDTPKLSENPNGTGPYRLKEWVHGDHITFEANPDYWGDAAKSPEVILKWSTEAAQRLLELQSGNADIVENIAPEDMETVSGDANLNLNLRAPLNIVYLGMNRNLKPFDNEKVRQAVAMALDKQRIVDLFYAPGSIAASQFAPPLIKPGYSDGIKLTPPDIEGAKALLAEAGFPNGFDVPLSYRETSRVYLPSPGKVAQEIQSQLAEVGINVKLTPIESATFIPSVRGGKEQALYLLGWGADYPDATNFFDTHFSAAVKQFGDVFPDIADEIHAGGTVIDPAVRQQHYDKVNELLALHVPMVPFANGVAANASNKTLEGAYASPVENEHFKVMSNGTGRFVYVQNAEPAVLWCADNEDGETFRACTQMYEGLYTFKVGGVEPVPALAESYEVSEDGLTYTFKLREGVKFFSGNELTANDVVASFASQWDVKNPAHKGEGLGYTYFGSFFGAYLNNQ